MSAPVFQMNFVQDIKRPIMIQHCGNLVFTGDNLSDTVSVSVLEDGEPYAISGTVAMNCIRADGATVTVTGSISGNTASATLTQACVAIPGPLAVVIKVTSDSTTTTLLKAVYMVDVGVTGTAVDPGTIIPDVTTLINAIETAVGSIPADYSDLLATIAHNFASGTYSAGSYVWNNGTLYKFTADHSGSWTGTDVEAVVIGDELTNLKSATDGQPDILATEETDADLYIADEDGNVIVQFEGGHIKTKNFDSETNKSNVMSKPITSNKDFVICDDGGNVILEVNGGNLKTKRFDSLLINPHKVVVKKDGSSDYTNLRDALESITDANAITNPYVIEIYEGTYNVLEDFTQAEIEDSDFVGLMITDGITLRGIGCRDNVILYGGLDPDDYTLQNRNNIATLNTKSECGMENLTVIAEKIRYCVHDDFYDDFRSHYGRNPKRTIKDCVFIGLDTTGVCTYGAGTSKARDFLFDNCLFLNETAGIHMQPGMKNSGQMIFENCTGTTLQIGDYSSSQTDAVHTLIVNGCNFKSIRFFKAQNGSYNGQHINMSGTGTKNAFCDVPTGFVYQTGDVVKTDAVLSLGDVVNADYGVGTITSVYGVCIGVYNDESYVQTGGFILASLLGLTANAGDYVGISNGKVSKQSTAEDSIGIVVSYNSKTYIKLTI